MRLCGHSCLAGRPQAQQLCAALSYVTSPIEIGTSQFFTTPQNFCTRLLPKIKVLSFFECKQTSVLLFSLPCAIYFAYMVSRSAQDYNMYNDRGCQNITADLEEFWADIPTATGLYRRNISLQANEWICYVMYVLF
jgi:hypothetical protein